MTESSADARTKILTRKTKKGTVVRLLREVYIRDDIPCFLSGCQLCSIIICDEQKSRTVLDKDASHFVLPTANLLLDYLELFELPTIVNIVLLQTVVAQVDDAANLRTLSRVKAISRDARRRSILFPNEHFRQTAVERRADETQQQRDRRAVLTSARWYAEHLKLVAPNAVLVLVTDEPDYTTQLEALPPLQHLSVLRLADYLKKYHPKEKETADLYESLTQSLAAKTEASGETIQQKFTEYLPDDVLEAGVKSLRFYKGPLYVSTFNRAEAYVHVDAKSALGKDILIPSSGLRNRAVHGDLVVVDLLPRSQWSAPSNLVATDEDEDADAVVATGQESRTDQAVPTGRVVGVVQRNWRSYVATLQLESAGAGGRAASEKVLAVPVDKRVPKVRMSSRQVAQLANSRIIIRIDDWPLDSNYPVGHYVRQLGPIGELETEIQSLLVENDVQVGSFSENMTSDLPPWPSVDRPWQVPASEIPLRKDLRQSHRIFSIDPLGSQDIDDALSARKLPNDRFEVGVHIADVSYFVREDSLLDLEARARGTTVYLPGRRYDMLPAVLSEALCSLRQGQDRFAFSVFWEFNSQLEITRTWFARTIIHSAGELHYQQAQNLYDGKLSESERRALRDYEGMRADLELLMRLGRKLREVRLQRGAVELESQELRFETDAGQQPTKLFTKQELEVNKTVAEWMILANESVAKRIHSAYPTHAILRHHPLPRRDHFDNLVRCAATKGFVIDTSSNKRLSQSLAAATVPADPSFNKILRTLATQAMAEAEYISTGSHDIELFYHYGLAADFYTHFTSPIRRYADIIAHRQLWGALQKPATPQRLDDLQLQSLCDHLNRKHRNSKQVQRDTTDLYASLYFRNHRAEEDGVVIGFKRNALLIMLPKYGLKGPVAVRSRDGRVLLPRTAAPNQCEVSSVEVDQEHQQLTVTGPNLSLTLNLFDHVVVVLDTSESRTRVPSIRFNIVRLIPSSLLSSVVSRVNLVEAVTQAQKREEPSTLLLPKPIEQQTIYQMFEHFKQLKI